MTSEFRTVPADPTAEMGLAALKALNAPGGNVFQAVKDAIAASPQPPALGGELIKRYVMDATNGRRPEMAEDPDGFYCAYEHVAPLLAEIEKWKSVANDIAIRRDELKSEVDLMSGELGIVREERDTLKARCEEASELLDIWRTWLGASRESCDETGKVLWDRITAVVGQAAPAVELVERGSTHGFEQSPNTCRHDDKSGVWWREGSVTRTGRECNACGRVFEDAPAAKDGAQ